MAGGGTGGPDGTSPPTHAGPPTLVLRPWRQEDAAAFRAAVDEDVAHVKPWLSWTLEEPATLERTRARLAEWVEQFERGERYRWTVVPAHDPGRILGGVNLGHRVGPDAPDVGWWLRRSASGRGIAGAAVTRLLVHAFDDRRARRVVAFCDPGNERSIGFARGMGFRETGEHRFAWPDGRPRPVRCYEMDRSGWAARAVRFRARASSVTLTGAR